MENKKNGRGGKPSSRRLFPSSEDENEEASWKDDYLDDLQKPQVRLGGHRSNDAGAIDT